MINYHIWVLVYALVIININISLLPTGMRHLEINGTPTNNTLLCFKKQLCNEPKNTRRYLAIQFLVFP
jgi:hypothetical protein